MASASLIECKPNLKNIAGALGCFGFLQQFDL